MLDPRYTVVLCDLWGCVHNGVAPFDGVREVLRQWKAEGRFIVFLTNAPRPAASVREQIEGLGIGEDCYDAIVSSGDAAIAWLQDRPVDTPRRFIGTARDRDALEAAGLSAGRAFAAGPAAGLAADPGGDIVCCGFAEGHQDDLDHYRGPLEHAAAAGATLICLNPDIEVERGGTRELCAGAIAALFEEFGGQVVYFGKPYAPIYDRALAKAHSGTGKAVERAAIVAIGDNARTDLRGADLYGLPFIYVASGVGAGLNSPDTIQAQFGDTLDLVASVSSLADLA